MKFLKYFQRIQVCLNLKTLLNDFCNLIIATQGNLHRANDIEKLIPEVSVLINKK